MRSSSTACRTREWLSALSRSPPTASSSPWFGKRALVIVNPIGGQGHSRRWCRTLVRPVLEAHSMRVTVFETQRAGHAAEYIDTHAEGLPAHFDLLIMLSGDGLLSEVLNAIVVRAGRALPPGSDVLTNPASGAYHAHLRQALHALPIAVLPGGTSNGLVASLFTPAFDVVDVLRRVMVAKPRSVDILSVQTPTLSTGARGEPDPISTDFSRATARSAGAPVIKVDMLTYLYGMVADNDNYVERALRSWPHLLRTTIAPLAAIALSRPVKANVRFKPLPFTAAEQAKYHYTPSHALERWAADECAERSACASGQDADGWRVIRADWTSLVVLNVAWPASDVCFAPSAQPDDGALYICAVQGAIPRWRTLYMFLQLSDGSHNRLDECQYFKADEICIHPHNDHGNMIISGEPLQVQSTHIRVQHKAACFVF